MRWGVVVAAGGLVKDPLASAIGTPRKALAEIKGRTCIERVLSAVQDAGLSDCVTVSGDDVGPFVSHGQLVIEAESQIDNARLAVEALPDVDAVLFLPADSPFLTSAMLASFISAVESRVQNSTERWLATGLTTLEEFTVMFPRMHPTAIHLKDGSFLSGALYAASPAAFFHAIGLLGEMSRSRKNQIAMLWRLGPWTVVRYFLHRVSIADAEERLGRLFGGKAVVVPGCSPLMAADIDQVADYDELRIFASLSEDKPGS